MRWRSKANDWKRSFALLPVHIGGDWLWLEWYWRRFCGDCYGVSIADPATFQQEGGRHG